MFSRKFFSSISAAALFLAGAVAISAQNAPVTGKVELKKKDGTKEPVAGALVEVYRVDIESNPPSAKTDKKGIFNFAGLPMGATFALSISAPGAAPSYIPNIHPGRNTEGIVVTLDEGDGTRWTEQQVRAALKNASGGGGELTAAEKKEQEEYAKKKAEIEAKNKDIENKNAIIQRSLQEGNDAFKAKNYDLAIEKYTEGVNADPEYVGSAPILLNNRGAVLKVRGVDQYNKSVKLADPEKSDGLQKAKADLDSSLASFKKSYEMLKNTPATEIPNAESHARTKYDALVGLTESYRLLVATKLNPGAAAEAKEAYDAYLEVETDPAKKAKAQLSYADIMREIGDSDKAIAGYRIVLQNQPDNADAMAGLGLSLFNSGVIANDKAQMQEGLNYMQKFADTAPDTHPLKTSVKEAVDYLKTAEKLAPQKVATPRKRP